MKYVIFTFAFFALAVSFSFSNSVNASEIIEMPIILAPNSSHTTYDCLAKDIFNNKEIENVQIRLYNENQITKNVEATIRGIQDNRVQELTSGTYVIRESLPPQHLITFKEDLKIDWNRESRCWKMGKATYSFNLKEESDEDNIFTGKMNISPRLYINPNVPRCIHPMFMLHPGYNLECRKSVKHAI
ncbi:MAG: hypothetical protein HQK51_02700 [Oligoflexia bacterium]|nr:hypothetical protein [Oligoflexia bacterium]